MGVVYFSIIPTFEPSRYCKCWIVCFYYILFPRDTKSAGDLGFGKEEHVRNINL